MEEFRKLRKKEGLTINQMAKRLKISCSYLEKLEAGFKKPSRNFMCKVKEIYPRFDINFFLFE